MAGDTLNLPAEAYLPMYGRPLPSHKRRLSRQNVSSTPVQVSTIAQSADSRMRRLAPGADVEKMKPAVQSLEDTERVFTWDVIVHLGALRDQIRDRFADVESKAYQETKGRHELEEKVRALAVEMRELGAEFRAYRDTLEIVMRELHRTKS